MRNARRHATSRLRPRIETTTISARGAGVREADAPQLENPVAKRDFGVHNGETRTRTGDTTIFSRGRLSLKSGVLQGIPIVSATSCVSEVLPDFPRVSRTLRPMTRLVGLFVVTAGR